MNKENRLQKEFRLAMNDLMATKTSKNHFFETKNDYKDYPCECGATSNSDGSSCWRYKAVNIKEKFYKLLQEDKQL